jgi:hypothetical protein
MNFILEPKTGHSLQELSFKLNDMNVAHDFTDTDDGSTVIKAELIFDQVCELKDIAYCICKEK